MTGTLNQVCELPELKDVSSVSDICDLRKKLDDAKQAVRELESALAGFGEHDNN